jgi:hypothetical protein
MTKSAPRKVAARKARSAKSKTSKRTAKARSAKSKTSKRTAKARAENSQSPGKLAAKSRDKVAAETVRESTQRMIEAQFDPIRRSQVPESFRVVAERNVAQARQVYEGSMHTLEAVLESWQKSFGAAGQGAAALNRRLIDLTERNINSGLDLATGLAGARNLVDVMDLQANYWRKLLGDLQPERRSQSTARIGRRKQ